MRVESLEPRALLSVTVLNEAFKAVQFTAAGRLTGDLAISGANWALQGEGDFAGTIAYDAYDHGVIGDRGAAISGFGTWAVDILSGIWDLGGHAEKIEDRNGVLSGSAVVDHAYVKAPIAASLTGTYQVCDSVFDTSDFSLEMRLKSSQGSLAFTGNLTPAETEPFDVVVTPTWGDQGVNVAVNVPGRVHASATHSTPVGEIQLYWARKAKLLSALNDKIPVYWNEASGSYTITDLPPAPAEATGLAFVAKFDGKTKTVSLPLLSVLETSVPEGDSSDPPNENQAVFPVVLAQPYSQPVTVRYTTVKGSAKPGIDFQPTTGSIVIPAGETGAEIAVPILGNTKYEPDKTFSIRLTKAGKVALNAGYAKAACTITNDDLQPTIAIADASVVEPAKGTARMVFTVTLSNPSCQKVTVKYETRDGNAKAGEDYVATSGTLTFAPGKTSGTIAVPVKADREAGSEEFFVDLSAPENATIADGEGVGAVVLPLLSVLDTSVAEGDGSDSQGVNQAVFPVILSQTYSQPVTVWYTTVKGSAKPGIDFEQTTCWVVIAAGATQGEITIPILGDTTFEPDKTFSVKLTNAENVALDAGYAEARCTITNDDPQPAISITDSFSVVPAEATDRMVFTVILSNPSYQTIKVKYKTGDSSAKAGEDYVARSGTLTFAPGATTATITVTVTADREVGDETFFVNLSAPVHATTADGEAVGTIVELPSPPVSPAAARDAAIGQLAAPAELASIFEQLRHKRAGIERLTER